MSESEPDTLTGFVWGDRAVMGAFVLVAGWALLRPALDPGPLGMVGFDLLAFLCGIVSVAFWGALVWVVGPAVGVL